MIKVNMQENMKAGNTQRTIQGNTQGNAMVYILIAVALFGGLTLTLSRQSNQSDNLSLDDERVDLYANELLEYSGSTQNVVDMMVSTGSTIGDLNFVNPTDPAFNTGSNVHKIFHPQGGGLNYRPKMSRNIGVDATSAWFIQDNINVEWTDSTDTDAIIIAYNIQPAVCEKLNLLIKGDSTVPAATVDLEDLFDPDNFTEPELNTTNCAGCDGYVALCMSNAAGDIFGYYNIIAAR